MRCAAFRAEMGAGARALLLPDRDAGRDGGHQRALGRASRAYRNPRRAVMRRRRTTPRHGRAVALLNRGGGRTRTRPDAADPDAQTSGASSARSGAGPGHGRVRDRPGTSTRIRGDDAAASNNPAARRGEFLGSFFDAERPERYVEYFVVDSWMEHLRQHARGTLADQDIFEHARTFQIGDGTPAVGHQIAAD